MFLNYIKARIFLAQICMLPMRHRSMLNCRGLFNNSLSKHSALVCVSPHGMCLDVLYAPMRAMSRVSMPPAALSLHAVDLLLITRVGLTLLQSAHFGHRTHQHSTCSATPLWKQKLNIGSTIYRRVVIPNPAALEVEKSSSKSSF